MENKKILLTTVAGTIFCVLFALIFFGFNFFDFQKPPIYFLVLGIAGSLSLALFKQKRTRDAIFINILVYFLFSLIVVSMKRPILAVILLIYFTAMVAALYFYVHYFDKKLAHLPIARSLILAAMVGLFYVAANFLHGLLFISQFSTRFLLGNLPIGFLLGLGFGLGDEVVERYFIKAKS